MVVIGRIPLQTTSAIDAWGKEASFGHLRLWFQNPRLMDLGRKKSLNQVRSPDRL